MKKYFVRVNGVSYEVEVEEIGGGKSVPRAGTGRSSAATENTSNKDTKNLSIENLSSDCTKIISPMPGTVLKLNVNVGSRVTKGQVLLILEAMKMENEIQAPCDGVVTGIGANKGVQVNAGDLLLTLDCK